MSEGSSLPPSTPYTELDNEALHAAARILNQYDSGPQREAYHTSEFEETVSEYAASNAEETTRHNKLLNEMHSLKAEMHENRKVSILNFQKVGSLREERDFVKERAELADKDYLTGILNRRGLEEKYTELVHAAEHRRANHTDSILFVDADNFKEVNTLMGHDGGDTALKIIAKSIELQIRQGDIAGRWGGDEFFVILTDIPQEDAMVVAEKIRAAISGLEGMPIPITVSIGVDTIDRNKKLSATAKFANEAMAEAKRNGRNQIMVVGINEENRSL